MARSTTLALRELDSEEAYEAELAKCTGVTGYHRWFFLHALSEALGLRLRAFGVDADGEPIGVLPVLLRRRGPVSTINYLPVQHVGPVLRDEWRLADALRAADPYLLRQRAVVTRWAFAPGVTVDSEILTRRGFHVSLEENFFVPADRSLEGHLAALPKKQRWEIKVGQSRGMYAGPSTPEEITEWFPNRVSDPYERQGIVPSYSRAAARQLAERLATDPRMQWRSVRNDERLLAMTVAIVDPSRLWFWLLVGERVKGPSPHAIGYWDLIESSLSRGLACDFGGAPTQGIRDFKVRMGGVLERGVTAERVRPRAYRVGRSLHARISRAWM